MSERTWRKASTELEKFADVISAEEYRHTKGRRHLPDVQPYRPTQRTEELELRRETDQRFRLKKIE